MFASYAGLLSASTFSRSRIAHQVAEDDRVVAGILAASLNHLIGAPTSANSRHS